MCETKNEARTKIDLLINAVQRLTNSLDRLSVANVRENGLELNTGNFGSRTGGGDSPAR